MGSPFRKVRGISDRQLGAALTDHQQALRNVLIWVNRHDYAPIPFTGYRVNANYLKRAWGVVVTLVLAYLLTR